MLSLSIISFGFSGRIVNRIFLATSIEKCYCIRVCDTLRGGFIMKYLKQFGIILLISFLGEFLHHMIPIPVPASIYGIVIMFLCLQFKIIRLSAVEETGKFLIEIMPVMFIPAAVELMESFQIIKASCLQYAVIIVVSTVLVMAVSGRVTQFVAHHKDKGVKQND